MVTEDRIREIAEKAISYLYEHDELADFEEDADIDFTDEERRYFEIENGEDNEITG